MTQQRLTLLSSAILLGLGLLPHQARTATITVDNTNCTLDEALASAESDSSIGGCDAGNGNDVLVIIENLNVTGQRRIVSNVRIIGAGFTPKTITGNAMNRIFFVGDDQSAPIVSFENVILTGGTATGGSGASGGGGGAGMGGIVFIYDGNVLFDDARINGGIAQGGNGTLHAGNTAGGGGGGGMAGAGGNGGLEAGSPGINALFGAIGGGGGGGGSTGTSGGMGGNEGGGGGNTANSGGNGAFFGSAGGGGGGSDGAESGGGGSGNFGGGGGGGGGATVNVFPGIGGNGGFGSGGGAAGGGEGVTSFGGVGGFGGGGGAGGRGEGLFGEGGAGGLYGGMANADGGGGGGAMGGGIFVRTGTVTIIDSTIDFNQSIAGSGNEGSAPGLSKAGGLFVLSNLTNPSGNNQGMPGEQGSVVGCGNRFFENGAANTAFTDTDSPDTFGVSEIALSTPCDDMFADSFEDAEFPEAPAP
jgi:hypothetical protein